MNKLQTHFRSSSTPPVAGTTGGAIHGDTNHKSIDGGSANSDRLAALPATPLRTPRRLATQTIAFASSNPTTPSIDDSETGNGRKLGLSQIPTGTPESLQRENIERGTFRHEPSPSLHYHFRNKIEEDSPESPDAASRRPHFTQHPTLRMHIQKSRSISTTSVATPHRSNGITSREHAMRELLSSERRYARDLALVCNIHIPIAQGKPISVNDIPGPSPLQFTASNSSTNSSQSRPLMTSDDVGTVFRNISDIANFSSQFVKRLETTFDRAFDGSSDEDKVGKLFLEIIPTIEPLYKTYLGTHSAALAHCQQLLLSPALWSYTSDIRNQLSDTRIPDLPSFLLKPQKRVSEYCHLLDSIINDTPVSHRGRATLVQARDQMERVAIGINNGRNIARGVLSINTTSIANGINGHGTTESNKLARLESRLKAYPNFLDKLAERVKDWAVAMRHSIESLQKWGITFGAVLGLVPSPSAVHYPAYEVFTSLLSSLPGMCTSLENDLQKNFNPLLRKLKEMTENPQRRLNEMRSLESARTPSSPLARFRGSDTSKSPQHYLQLRSMLLGQLPALLQAMDRATALAVLIVAQRQATFFNVVRDEWIKFFDSMMEEGEHYGGTEETLRAWRARWEGGLQMLLGWEKKYRPGESAVRQNSSATWSEISLPVQLSMTSAGLPPVNDMSRFPLGAPRRLRTSISYPPGPPSSRRTRQSIAVVAPVPYTIQVRQSYTPPPHIPYWGYPFFKLAVGDSFEVVHEYGHPSTHTDLPPSFLGKEREDCLLKVRAKNRGVEHEAGDVGWALARFVSPD